MSENTKLRLKSLQRTLSRLASVFALAWGETDAYKRILSALNDVNALLEVPTGEYSPHA